MLKIYKLQSTIHKKIFKDITFFDNINKKGCIIQMKLKTKKNLQLT